jgi:hypothetical protein
VDEVRALCAATLPDDPPAEEAAEMALRWIEESGTTALLSAWKVGLPSTEPALLPA